MNYQKIMDALIFKRKAVEPLTKTKHTGDIETHHIVMRSLGGDDLENNLVNLTLAEHYFIHELLVQIYKGTEYELTARRAWNGMSRTMGNAVKTSKLYKILRAAYNKRAGESIKGKTVYNDGQHNRYFQESDIIPEGFVKGPKALSEQAIKNRQIAAEKQCGKIRVNNGQVEKVVDPDKIPQGFVRGNLPTHVLNTGKICVNNGHEERFVLPDKIPEGFIRGRLPFSESHRKALKLAHKTMDPDTKRKRSEKLSRAFKGKSNWAKGTKQSPEHVAKRTAKIRGKAMPQSRKDAISAFQRGKIKVNNGVKTIYADPNNIPDGFVPGQLHLNPRH